MTTLNEEALTYNEMYRAFRHGGFTRWEALTLIANVIVASGQAEREREE